VTRQTLVVAILFYVTLDLSLAAMPGAFVFEPADSIESAHAARAHRTGPLVSVPASAGDTAVTLSPRPVAPSTFAAIPRRHSRRVVSCLPRAVLAPAVSEDVH
jgi:hypothetical protein